jgi:hypothetical protein
VQNNRHWGGVYIEFEVWETYYTPGFRRYEYQTNGATYTTGGILSESTNGAKVSHCTLQLQYDGDTASSEIGYFSHSSRIMLIVPAYTTCFVRIKQSVKGLHWYPDATAAIITGNGRGYERWIQFMQRFAHKDSTVQHASRGDGTAQVCTVNC